MDDAIEYLNQKLKAYEDSSATPAAFVPLEKMKAEPATWTTGDDVVWYKHCEAPTRTLCFDAASLGTGGKRQ